MAITPSVKTYDQILGEALATYQSKIGVTDLNPGSAVVSFFESNAQMVYRVTGDVFQILKDYSIDRATGDSLKRLAQEENVSLRPAQAATSYVTIKDSSFEKIATKIYAGAKAPNAGSTVIYVGDITGFPSSGQIYIGRGTPNVEGPISYTSITPIGSYYQLSLSSPTVKFHNISETIILAQGGVRTISTNIIVQTASTGGTDPVKFAVTEKVIILDGENEVTKVPIAAMTPSVDGNVARNAIKEFMVEPFTGATVSNPSPITNGRNDEDDESLRNRIKLARSSRGLGTVTAITSAVSGATSSEEPSSVVSTEIITSGGQTTLYIDDSTGYERKTDGVGVEYIVDSALGGENSFQLSTGGSQAGVAKAFVLSGNSQPFGVSGGQILSVLVGGTLSEHMFASTDFKSNGAATAYEVVASINSNYNLLFRATTSAGGTKVVIESKEETDEYLQLSTPSVGVDAAPYFNFPSEEVNTLNLFKNDSPLSSTGRDAYVVSNQQSSWSDTISAIESFAISVDGTPTQLYSISDQDFIDNTTSSAMTSSAPLSDWCAVFNAKIPGITATVDGLSIRLTSNKGKSNLASIEIDPLSSLVSKNMFSSNAISSVGVTKDYIFSRNTAQIKLISPLSEKDKLTAGSSDTIARLKSSEILGATVSIPSPGGSFWVFVDDPDMQMVNVALTGNQEITVSQGAEGITLYSISAPFYKVQAGDYVILWSNEFSQANRVEGRVIYATSTQITIALTAAELAAVIPETINYKTGLSVIRTNSAPQRIFVDAGTYNINELADTMNSQLKGAYFEIEKDSVFVLRADTINPSTGALLIPTVTSELVSMVLPTEVVSHSKKSQIATYETPYDIDHFPAFAHSTVSDQSANPPSSYLSSFTAGIDFQAEEIDPNELVSIINGYAGNKAQAFSEVVQMDSCLSSPVLSTVYIEQTEFIKRLRNSDRAYIALGYQFGASDSLIVVLDNNAVEKTFIVPLYREITTNSTIPNNASSFNAYDEDGGSLSSSFGSSFSFNNFKALLRAKVVLDQFGSQNAILYRAAVWGKSGEYYKISYEYPTTANSEISHSVIVDKETTIQILLKSGNQIYTTQDGTTEWDVTITPNYPLGGIDQVTYTWSGIGANPNLSLSGGEYVNILSTGTFDIANTGAFRVSTVTGFLPTAQSFTVQRKNGDAVSQTAAANIVPTTISFYQYSDTFANDIVSYVNSNLSQYVSAEIVDDNGMGGTGRLTVSTYEATNFASPYLYLKDGVNWIYATDLAGSPQFTFKNSLTYPSSGGYSFNNQEKLRLVPTTAEQVVNMMNTLSVTGLSTLATIKTSNKNKKVQISTNTLGSNGGIQIVGGGANGISVDVLESSIETSDIYGKTFVSASQLVPIVSGQLLKVESASVQEKNTNIENLNTIEILANEPSAGKSTILVNNRQINQRLFNMPRSHLSLNNNTWKVEKQGEFTCLSWTGDWIDPLFEKPANLNFFPGDTVQFNKITNTEFLDVVVFGKTNFQEIEIGNYLTITGTVDYDGSFEVQGKSDDQTTLRIISPNAVSSLLPIALSWDTLTCIRSVDEGDALIINEPFSPLNHGQFRVVRKYKNSVYYRSINFKEETVAVSNVPELVGDGTQNFKVTKNGYTELSWDGVGTDPVLSSIKVGDKIIIDSGFSFFNRGAYTVLGVENNKIIYANPISVNEYELGYTPTIYKYTPSISFYDYDSAVAGDKFVIRGSSFNSRAGSYTVESVLSKNCIVVNGVIEDLAPTLLGANSDNVLLEEQYPYVGYKKVRMVSIEPTNPNLGIIVWDNKKQIDKINELSGSVISAVSKLRYPNTNKQGYDAYRYDKGLLAEVNRIVYGDPRDRTTYPGVAAAGVEIFINPPLIKRVSVGVVVRLNTGIPLIQVVEQVRNSIAALIDGNPIGQSIAISKIVSAVDAIPGVRAMAVTSPQYDQTNDLIVIQPSEKSLVIDVVTDISVSQLG